MNAKLKIVFIVLGIIGIVVSFQMDILYVPLPVPENLSDVEIKMEKTVCFGPCPVYSVIVHGNGTVHYNGIKFVDNVGKSVHQISKEDVTDIVELIYGLNYFSLKDRYEHPATDMSTVITSVKINNDQKMVTNYGHYGPDRLHKIEEKIDALTNFILFLTPDLSAKTSPEPKGERFCAYIGFEKYPENLFVEFLENPYNKDVTFLNFTDADLKQIPEFYDLILESSKVSYSLNDRVRFAVSPDEYGIIKNHFEQRSHYEFNKNGETVFNQNGGQDSVGNYRTPQILMDGKLYGTHGLNAQVFSDRDVNMNIEYNGTFEEAKARLVENTNPNRANLIYFEIEEDDKIPLASILDAISNINKSKDKIRMSEDVGSGIQDKTQNFFLKQNKIQFDNNESKYTHYFILNGTMYETSFVIC